MSMRLHNLVQGGAEWHAARVAADFTASEAPIVMGASKKLTRAALIRMRATGGEQEFSQWLIDNVFARGHEVEALARPIIEGRIGEDLYPVTGEREVEGLRLLASFDGLTMLYDHSWECKQWNEAKASEVRVGRVPDEDYWQVVHQLIVSCAEVATYTVSDGTEAGTISTQVVLDPEHRYQLIAAYKQAKSDLLEYVHQQIRPEAVAAPQEALPAVTVQVSGQIAITDNLPAFGEALTAYVERLNLKPETDQDFADLDAACKSLKRAEEALISAETNALAQTSSIEEMRRAVATYRDLARNTRLQAEKVVKAEKENRRAAIHAKAVAVVRGHYDKLNATLGGFALPFPQDTGQRIAAAMKGKKTILSLQDAADGAVAEARIAANDLFDGVRASLAKLAEVPVEYRHLFHDRAALAMEPVVHVEMTIKARIADYKEAEAKRLEAERQRIREEEERKAREAMEVEQRRLEQRKRHEQEEADRRAAWKCDGNHGGAPCDDPECWARSVNQVSGQGRENQDGEAEVPRMVEELMVDKSEPATLKLGDIRDRLGFALPAAFIEETLAIQPAAKERSAVLFLESQWPAICRALVAHVLECEGTAVERREAV